MALIFAVIFLVVVSGNSARTPSINLISQGIRQKLKGF